MTTVPPIPPAAPGLTPEMLRQLAEARVLAARVRRAVLLATLDYWSVGIFAALTLLGSFLSFSLSGLMIGCAMGAVVYFEIRGTSDLKKLDPTAPKRLGMNQLFFGLALFTYAAYSLFTGLRNPGEYSGLLATQMPPELMESSMVTSINDLTRLILIVLYGTLALVAITVQGGTALFYFSREKHLRRYLETTPSWILQAQREGLPL